jgi:Zn-dependent M28 family amino/carboxypeptidase
MMAHLDHVGRRSPKNGDAIVNGALDNAAGVAIMLDVARAMVRSPTKPRRSILFLANTAEEPGLLGTHYFAAAPTVPLDSIVGVLNLDVPLVTYEFSDVVGFGADHSTLGANLAKVAGATGVAVTPDPVPAQGLFTRSDHYAMVQKGIPALFLIPGHAGGGQQAWQTYLSQHYHQPSDDLSQPFNWQAAARFARINWLLLRDVANDAERPRWYQGSYFGETFAPEATKAVKR